MELEPQEEKHSETSIPSSFQVLQRALTKIEPDRSVIVFDEELGRPTGLPPWKPISLSELPPEVYGRHLLEVSRALIGTCENIAVRPQFAESELQILARYLTGYRHDPTFLKAAASLASIEENGLLREPTGRDIDVALKRLR